MIQATFYDYATIWRCNMKQSALRIIINHHKSKEREREEVGERNIERERERAQEPYEIEK